MKKKNMYDIILLDAWNPVKKSIEKLEVQSNIPYEVEMEDKSKKIFIFDLSPKFQKKIKRAFNYENPSIIPYSYVWNDSECYFEEEYGVLDVERLKHIQMLHMTFIANPTTNTSKALLKQFLCCGEKKFTVDINAPLRINIQGLHGSMPETWYGTYAEYKPPKFFGLFGNILELRTYNGDNRALPYVWDRKVKLNKITGMTNGKFLMNPIKN